MELTDDQIFEVTRVGRTPTNERKIPNGHMRHDPFDATDTRCSSFHFLSEKPLEWLSLNYRKERAVKISSSLRRKIFIKFQKDIPYFLTLKEIRDELILTQIHKLQNIGHLFNNQTKLDKLKQQFTLNWRFPFGIANLNHHFSSALTPQILSNPYDTITRHILYIYTMEYFIFANMNRASRKKE